MRSENMSTIYIFGHKKPDTDSVTSAISLSYLKNQLGYKTSPRILGSVNLETKFALDYFHVPEPKYLNDVRLQLKDVAYTKGCYMDKTASIEKTFQYMNENGLTGLPIIDSNKNFLGLITIKDLARELVNGNFEKLNSSYDNIIKVLKGEEVLRFDEEIDGNLLVASYKSTTFMENVMLSPNMILIVGDRHNIIEYAINSKVKMIVVTGGNDLQKEHIELARKNKVNIIKTPYDSFHTSKLISYSNYIENILVNSRPVSFEENDYVDDFLEVNNKLKHTNYPILNRKGECLGLLRLTDLNEKNRKKVILVDHNEKAQSADGIEDADILEIIDHHNLGSLTTKAPISFRNMAVGSTNTIIYYLYKENHIKIPKEIAGMMLSGILSDTLILKSPTTTKIDKETVEELAKIAGVDYKTYGTELLKAGTSLKGKTKEELLYTDYKIFTINEKNIGIGQIMTMNFDEIKEELEEYVTLLNQVAENNNHLFETLFVTDIIKNGSYVLYSDRAKNVLELAYSIENIEQGHFLPGCVSRKKQMVPYIIDVLDKE